MQSTAHVDPPTTTTWVGNVCKQEQRRRLFLDLLPPGLISAIAAKVPQRKRILKLSCHAVRSALKTVTPTAESSIKSEETTKFPRVHTKDHTKDPTAGKDTAIRTPAHPPQLQKLKGPAQIPGITGCWLILL